MVLIVKDQLSVQLALALLCTRHVNPVLWVISLLKIVQVAQHVFQVPLPMALPHHHAHLVLSVLINHIKLVADATHVSLTRSPTALPPLHVTTVTMVWLL